METINLLSEKDFLQKYADDNGQIGIVEIKSFFDNFEYPKNHESSFGGFTNYGLKEFVENHIICAERTEIKNATRAEIVDLQIIALTRLIRVMSYLSTGRESYRVSRKLLKR
jgi:hypothetical protein